METVDASVAAAQFEVLLERVEHEHKTVILMRGNREVARLEPASFKEPELAEHEKAGGPLARFRFPGTIVGGLENGVADADWALD